MWHEPQVVQTLSLSSQQLHLEKGLQDQKCFSSLQIDSDSGKHEDCINSWYNSAFDKMLPTNVVFGIIKYCQHDKKKLTVERDIYLVFRQFTRDLYKSWESLCGYWGQQLVNTCPQISLKLNLFSIGNINDILRS